MSLNNNKRCTTPVARNAFSGACASPKGGFRVPTVPSIALTVQNEVGSNFWTDEDFRVVFTDDDQYILFDNI